jgi:hypothetical protein
MRPGWLVVFNWEPDQNDWPDHIGILVGREGSRLEDN